MSEGKQWTVGEVLQWTKQFFTEKGIDNPRLDAEVLLAHILRTDRLRLYVEYHKPLQPEELAAYRELIKQRAQRIPIAYLLGEKEFMGLPFLVSDAVLIPRPDTEILVEVVLNRIKHRESIHILDVGTGSGAIILSLLKSIPIATGVAVDISSAALEVAQQNARRLGVAERVEFHQGDLFAPVKDRVFSVIVSNPPYIPSADIKQLEPELFKEPLKALDGGADGLDFYRKIVANSIRSLEIEGLLAFEVGIGQAKSVAAIMEQTAEFVGIEILTDYGGVERVVLGWKSGNNKRV